MMVPPTLCKFSVAPMTATLFGFNIAHKIGLRSPIGLGGIAAWRGTGVLMLRRGYPLCAETAAHRLSETDYFLARLILTTSFVPVPAFNVAIPIKDWRAR
jgi:hypothetical protein